MGWRKKRTGKNNERVNNTGKSTTLRSGVTLLPDFRVTYAAKEWRNDGNNNNKC